VGHPYPETADTRQALARSTDHGQCVVNHGRLCKKGTIMQTNTGQGSRWLQVVR
jgi:hypothetical protein